MLQDPFPALAVK